MATPFDYINNISQSREDIWQEGFSEKEYSPFLTNRGLSQFQDTIHFAQFMNQYSQYIPPRMQYDFYRLGIDVKKKRFARWSKSKTDSVIEKLAIHYGINKKDIEQYISLLNSNEIDEMILQLHEGGSGKHGKPRRTTK